LGLVSNRQSSWGPEHGNCPLLFRENRWVIINHVFDPTTRLMKPGAMDLYPAELVALDEPTFSVTLSAPFPKTVAMAVGAAIRAVRRREAR
jgi:hypothetical protein